MNRVRCIKQSNLPPRLPILSTAVIWLLVDRYDVPGAWRGVIWTLWAIWWALVCAAVWFYEPVDVLAEQKRDLSIEPISPDAVKFVARAFNEAKKRGMTA